MAVSKITLKEGNEIKAQIDLSKDTVKSNVLLKGYTAHDDQGEEVIGTYEPETPIEPVLIEKTINQNGEYLASQDGADGFSKVNVNVQGGGEAEETWTLVIDSEFEPELGAFSIAHKYSAEITSNEIFLRAVAPHTYVIPTDWCITQCNWNEVMSSGLNYDIYVDNEFIADPSTIGIRGKAGETHTISLRIDWDITPEAQLVSAADCKFDDNGTLLSFDFTKYTGKNNFILPDSYNMVSQSYDIDCRTNDLYQPYQVQTYMQNNHISYPVTLTDGNGNTITINAANEWWGWEVENFFNNAKITYRETQVGGETYTMNGTTIETPWGNFELIGTLNTSGSTITSDKYTFYYDVNDGHYRPDPNEWPNGNSYVFIIVDQQVQEYAYQETEDPNWTITLTYTQSTFSDGNDYTVTKIGGGDYSIFEEFATSPSDFNFIRRIQIPDSVQEISLEAFRYCKFIREYVLPENLIHLGSLCGSYTTLVIPNKVESLGVLEGCFTNLNIPDSVQLLDGNFDGHSMPTINSFALTTLTFENGALTYDESYSLLDINAPNLQKIYGLPNTNIKTWNGGYMPLLDTITPINNQQLGLFDLSNFEEFYTNFYDIGCAGRIREVILTNIHAIDHLFMGCYNLLNIRIPNNCLSLNDIELSLGGNQITITLEGQFKELNYAVPMKDGSPVFAYNLEAIYVPMNLVEYYKEATNWINYADLIQGDPDLPDGPEPGPGGNLVIDRVYLGSAGSDDTLDIQGGSPETPLYALPNSITFEAGEYYTFIAEAHDNVDSYEFAGFSAAELTPQDFPGSTSNYYSVVKSGEIFGLQINKTFYGTANILIPISSLLENGNLNAGMPVITYTGEPTESE